MYMVFFGDGHIAVVYMYDSKNGKTFFFDELGRGVCMFFVLFRGFVGGWFGVRDFQRKATSSIMVLDRPKSRGRVRAQC